MPIYEYYCKKCKTKAEEMKKENIQYISCPHCGEKAYKVTSSFNFNAFTLAKRE